MLSALLSPDKRKIILTVLLFLAMPAFFIALLVYSYMFVSVSDEVRSHFSDQKAMVASKHRAEVDAYLGNLVTTLRLVSELLPAEQLLSRTTAEHAIGNLNLSFRNVFESLGLYGADGIQLAYAGFSQEAASGVRDEHWFGKALQDGMAISDVYSSNRHGPHFFIAIRQDQGAQKTVLCATVNAFAFSAILDGVKFGRTGEVYIINADGVLQTRSFSGGAISQTLEYLTPLVREGRDGEFSLEREGTVVHLRLTRLESWPDWWLVVQREAGEQKQVLFEQMFGLVMLFGLCLLFLLTASHLAIVRLLRHYEVLESSSSQVQNQSAQSQKRMAIEQLSIGLAHEINNPLAIIGEEAGWMQDILKRDRMSEFPDGDEIKDSLSVIAKQIGRCREITHKLLSFARKLNFVIRDVDLKVLLGEVVGMRQEEASSKNITISTEYSADLPIIHNEPTLLRQALLSLLDNAIDAVNDSGKISLSAVRDKDGFVRINVRDTGRGIPKENIDRVFDPFFTTKDPGKGTGLGLSICQGIIQKLGGEVTVASQPGQETIFTIRLPQDPPVEEA
jgi:two-component system NtrC family sensor kinase